MVEFIKDKWNELSVKKKSYRWRCSCNNRNRNYFINYNVVITFTNSIKNWLSYIC